MTTEEPSMANGETTASRRAVLQGAAVAGVAGVAGFVAYSARDETAGATYEYPGGGGGGEVVAALADVPPGGGLIVPDAQVVLVRDSQGAVQAFSAVCTHQSCLVSQVVGGQIQCPCHGSVFDAATGEVLAGPAAAPLPPVAVRVDGDSVVTG
jgi:nitrite reductase/ring-hydroxylating ferredoxin subunit